jgi:hypothetical protein
MESRAKNRALAAVNRYVLEAIDPATASIALEARFEVKTRSELRLLLDMPDDELTDHASYDLKPFLVAKIVSYYGLSFEPGSMPVKLHPWHPIYDLPYKVHTGRELAMMLAGTKPLAVFSDAYPKHHDFDNIPEREFEPHVRAGRIIKREHIEPPGPDDPVINGQPIGARRVLYALPGEEWRIDAYLQLWGTCKKTGWTAEMEREEGTLLGYEDWQNDIHMKGSWRPPPRIPNP